MLLITVGLIGGRHHNRRDLWRAAAGLEQIPGTLNIGGEGQSWVAIGDANDGLGRHMKDNLDFVLAQHAPEPMAVGDLPAPGNDLLNATIVHAFVLLTQSPSRKTPVDPGSRSCETSHD